MDFKIQLLMLFMILTWFFSMFQKYNLNNFDINKFLKKKNFQIIIKKKNGVDIEVMEFTPNYEMLKIIVMYKSHLIL